MIVMVLMCVNVRQPLGICLASCPGRNGGVGPLIPAAPVSSPQFPAQQKAAEAFS